MTSILVVYGTGEGQTAKVAERLVGALVEHGHTAEAFDVKRLPAGLDLDAYDAVLVGASIHVGKHQKAVKSFVRSHLEALEARPAGFFQVSLSAAIDDEPHRAEALGYIEDLVEDTGWQPDRTAVFGGAIRYSEYGFLTRSLMKSIARKETGDVDTSRDYEYTDWEEVDRFAADFGAFEEDRLGSGETAEPETAH